ncbi:MAG: hypothetical protein U0103_00420 [Candidatus Obscuribacterales bacterium]
MTDTAKYNDSDIISMALEALSTSDLSKSEEAYNQIVLKVQKAFNNNQRDVASELQRLSKCIEASRNTEDSLTFKQRTCESMLKISMAERHKGKPLPVLAAAKHAPPFKSLEYLILGSNNFEGDFRFYRDTIKSELLWAFNKAGIKLAAFRMAYGPVIVLSDKKEAGACEQVYSVGNLELSIKELRERGIEIPGPVETPLGRTYTFKDVSGNSCTILQNDAGDSLERAYQDRNNTEAIRLD